MYRCFLTKTSTQVNITSLFWTALENIKNRFIIYIAEKFPLFIPSKDKILVKRDANFFAWEEDRMTSVDYNILRGRPHASTWALAPLPLRVDVITGWPIETDTKRFLCSKTTRTTETRYVSYRPNVYT